MATMTLTWVERAMTVTFEIPDEVVNFRPITITKIVEAFGDNND